MSTVSILTGSLFGHVYPDIFLRIHMDLSKTQACLYTTQPDLNSHLTMYHEHLLIWINTEATIILKA